MKHFNKSPKISRRKFLAGGLATGAFAVGGIFSANNSLIAESIERLGGSRWEITIDGRVVKEGVVPLDKKEEVTVPVKNGAALIIMDHGRIYMSEDNDICTKKICSLMGSITKSGEKITCLPNRLVIRII
jgi:hypothetical protein